MPTAFGKLAQRVRSNFRFYRPTVTFETRTDPVCIDVRIEILSDDHDILEQITGYIAGGLDVIESIYIV